MMPRIIIDREMLAATFGLFISVLAVVAAFGAVALGFDYLIKLIMWVTGID